MVANLESIEVCPNCGDLVNYLNDSTGWCYTCSPPVCDKCGKSRTDSDHVLCITCRRELWLERNADRIEELLTKGLTFSEAKSKILRENRAVCVVCSSPIPGKNKSTTLFCKKNKECRRTRKKYLNRVRSGVPRELALEQSLREVLV